MRFIPPCCPYPHCPSHADPRPPRCHRIGRYTRKCDARSVPRFRCLTCKRSFSAQSFRLDFRLQKPWLNAPLAGLLCAKTTLRKAAEILGCDRKTLERRLRLFGPHCRAFHLHRLGRLKQAGSGLVCPTAQLDELETYEENRRLAPVTVPILIDRHTYFVIGVDAAPLPARGRLSEGDQKKRAEREARLGRRRNGSRAAVKRTLKIWQEHAAPGVGRMLQTDKKATYNRVLHEVFDPEALAHARVPSSESRNYGNLLFPINHTNALFRDSVSRLVRRTWAASKRLEPLRWHLWVFAVFRNYVRPLTRKVRRLTSAMALGVDRRRTWSQVLRYRAPFFSLLDAH